MIRSNLAICLISLRSNLLRSFLTMSGIVIGIAAVVTVLSIGKGHQQKIEAQIQKMGPNVFTVGMNTFSLAGGLPIVPFMGSNTSPTNKRPSPKPHRVSYRFLSAADEQVIKNLCTAVQWSAPVITSFTHGVLNGKTVPVSIIATSPELLKVISGNILSGRYISYEDMRMLNDVCAVEENPDILFPNHKDGYIFVNSRKFKIIGIVNKGGYQMHTNAVVIHIPLTVEQSEITGSSSVGFIHCLAKNNLLETAKQQVEIALQSYHEGEINFEIRSSRDIYNNAESLTRTATMVTAGIGMLSLFVGGIGIMNILLASVFERIKEIGIRRSVGARKRDILLQFLFESLTLTILGGIIGVVFGVFVTKILSSEMEIPSVISYESFLIGMITSSLIGIIFGIYPALKAANFNPIESLRYE